MPGTAKAHGYSVRVRPPQTEQRGHRESGALLRRAVCVERLRDDRGGAAVFFRKYQAGAA